MSDILEKIDSTLISIGKFIMCIASLGITLIPFVGSLIVSILCTVLVEEYTSISRKYPAIYLVTNFILFCLVFCSHLILTNLLFDLIESYL